MSWQEKKKKPTQKNKTKPKTSLNEQTSLHLPSAMLDADLIILRKVEEILVSLAPEEHRPVLHNLPCNQIHNVPVYFQQAILWASISQSGMFGPRMREWRHIDLNLIPIFLVVFHFVLFPGQFLPSLSSNTGEHRPLH